LSSILALSLQHTLSSLAPDNPLSLALPLVGFPLTSFSESCSPRSCPSVPPINLFLFRLRHDLTRQLLPPPNTSDVQCHLQFNTGFHRVNVSTFPLSKRLKIFRVFRLSNYYVPTLCSKNFLGSPPSMTKPPLSVLPWPAHKPPSLIKGPVPGKSNVTASLTRWVGFPLPPSPDPTGTET